VHGYATVDFDIFLGIIANDIPKLHSFYNNVMIKEQK
jgi:uncharacterized protein YutE (UPF0331/DUF86 family)